MSFVEVRLTPRHRLLWSCAVAAQALASIAFAWNPDAVGQALAATAVCAACIHATYSYGVRIAMALLAICVAVSLTVENVSAATGFPFGRYHFVVDAGLPHVGAIPVIVGLVWFGMGYFAWIVASILLDDADLRLASKVNRVALPIVAAFVMTQWDFTMDRSSSTFSGAWIWHDGGGDFGVPLTNYLGWFLTAWIFYQLYALCLAHYPPPDIAMAPALRWSAVLLYATAGLTHLTPWALGASGEIADATGHVWRVADIRETTVAVMFATMLFSSVLAGLKLLQKGAGEQSAQPEPQQRPSACTGGQGTSP